MKWLKWHHKFSSGHQSWQWKLIADDVTEKSAREEILPELADEYNHSEHYRGIDFEIVDYAPPWVVDMKIKAIEADISSLMVTRGRYVHLRSTSVACQQCTGARAPTDEERRVRSYREIECCPTCGRELWMATLNFWLMPNDREAVKLLGELVEKGPRARKGHDIDVEQLVKNKAALHRLLKLGLVSSSWHMDKVTLEASKRGKDEWAKHKAARAKRRVAQPVASRR
jgi:hypothetical protein